MKENLIVSLVDVEQMGIELTYPVAGTFDYDNLENKPSINGVVLQGNRSFSDLGLPEDIVNAATEWLTDEDIDSIIEKVTNL